MTSGELLRFRVDAYTPDTMPMARLADYLAEIAALLGDKNAVHFVGLESGSVTVVHRIDADAIPRVRHRIASVRGGVGPAAPRRAYDKINAMLRHDRGTAKLVQSDPDRLIIEFPGIRQIEGGLTGVIEHGSLDGTLIRVGGKAAEVPILLHRNRIDYAGIYASRATAAALAKSLFQPVRLSGIGRWSRTTEGEWLLDRFQVKDFEVLETNRLSDVLAELQILMGKAPSGVPSLAELRSGDAD